MEHPSSRGRRSPPELFTHYLTLAQSKFSETQIVGILKDAEAGVAVNDLLRTHGISRATFFKWRSKYSSSVSTGAIARKCSTPISLSRFAELRALTMTWLRIYNEERPHDSLGRVPPLTFLPRPTPAGVSTYAWST